MPDALHNNSCHSYEMLCFGGVSTHNHTVSLPVSFTNKFIHTNQKQEKYYLYVIIMKATGTVKDQNHFCLNSSDGFRTKWHPVLRL